MRWTTMPTYDARCKDCGTEFEETRRFDDPVAPCPECGGLDTHTVWLSTPKYTRVKDPYDLISSGTIPDSKPIKSYANDRRRGGKDRT